MPVYALGDDLPDIDPAAWLAPTAVAVGKVRLRAGAAMWFNAVARGDNEWIDIGSNSNVQDLCMLHTDIGFPLTIGRDCTVGHSAILHGCSIGDTTLIGMGAIVLNGARIGANSLVGAGALVPEGREYPDGSLLVGAPAKVVRQLDDAAIARLGASARNYLANWQRFQAGLRAV